jgi:hypothetical protein
LFKKDSHFLAALLLMSLVCRLALAFAFTEPPHIPHDTEFYINGALRLLSGESLYATPLPGHPLPYVYGPLTAFVHAAWISVFGQDFFLIKIPSILADIGTIAVIFFLARKLLGSEAARSTTLAYSMAYLALLNSMIGNDDSFFILLISLAMYFAVDGLRTNFSAACIAFALGFKPAAIFFILPIAAYFFFRSKKAAIYFTTTAAWMSGWLLAVFTIFDQNPIPAYFMNDVNVGLLEPLNLLRVNLGLAANALYFAQYNSLIPYAINPLKSSVVHPINTIINQMATPVLLFGLLIGVAYLLQHRSRNHEATLFRDVFVMTFVVMFFGNGTDDLYMVWALPSLFLLVAMSGGVRKRGLEGLIFMGMFVLAAIFRERPVGNGEINMLAMACVFIVAGTYFSFKDSPLAKSFAAFTLAGVMFRITLANPLSLFYPLFPMIPSDPVGYRTYIEYAAMFVWTYMTMVVMLFALVYLAISVHRVWEKIR